MRFEAVIGFEVHAQLATRTKIFCGCENTAGGEPNTRTCPVCLGLPGALPVLNEQVVDHGIRVALALEATLPRRAGFARKNYFYPDLPKGYQITQHAEPLATDGRLNVKVGRATRTVRVRQIHVEEDAGKSLHSDARGRPAGLVDLNRCGVPLIEIVTEPDVRSVEEADVFLSELRLLLMYLGAATGDMHEGGLRFDTNVSVRPEGDVGLGTQTEVKNLNSFKSVRGALEFEIDRQSRVIESGHEVTHETLLWDEGAGRTIPMRSKETTSDYRYFPEPDLVDFEIDDERVDAIRRSMPDTPIELRARFTSDSWYGLSDYDAGVLTSHPDTAVYFEEVLAKLLALCGPLPHGTTLLDPGVELLASPVRSRERMSLIMRGIPDLGIPDLRSTAKTVASWITVNVGGWLNEHPQIDLAGLARTVMSSQRLAEVLSHLVRGEVSQTGAKRLFQEAVHAREPVEGLLDALGVTQVSDEAALAEVVERVLLDHPEEVRRFRGGEGKLLRFFVGRVMKETGGKANPELATELLREALRAEK